MSNSTIHSRRAPQWAWDVILETLELDANSSAFDPELRYDLLLALQALQMATAHEDLTTLTCDELSIDSDDEDDDEF